MTALAIMLVVGLGDLVPDRWRARLVVRAMAWGVGVAIVWPLAGAPWWSAVLAVAVAAAWSMLRSRSSTAVAGALVLIVSIPMALLLDPSVVPSGAPLAAAVDGGALRHIVAPTVLLAIVAAVLLVLQSANRIVRVVLEAARIPIDVATTASAARGSGWRVRVAGRDVAEVRADVRQATATLLGGRIVGPLERVLLLAAFLGGVPMVAAGVLAAKGIVRFPEIAADGSGGTKAEEFLVGTFTSLAALVVAVLPVAVLSV